MDALIHVATGACIGWASPQRWAGRGAVRAAVAGALLPDADTLIAPFLNPQSGFAHRGFTHSLVGVAVLAPLAALVVWRLGREKGYARLVALVAMGMLSHLLLDLPTPMGTVLFFPFSPNYVHLDFLGYVDWTLFLLALFVLLAVWTYSKQEAAVRRGILAAALLSSLTWWLYAEWPALAPRLAATMEEATEVPLRTAYPLVLGGVLLVLFVALARGGWGFRQGRAVFGRFGVAAFGVYLVVCVGLQGIVLSRAQQFARERGIVVRSLVASRMGFSSLVGPLRWTGLILAPEGVYVAQVNPFSTRASAVAFFPSGAENPFVARSRSLAEVQRFVSGARFLVTRYRVEQDRRIVEYQEYGLSWRPLLRVAFDERQKVLVAGRIKH
jgi:membrane-bound metal-dependent hydrolase YbcI (DUF457 family)